MPARTITAMPVSPQRMPPALRVVLYARVSSKDQEKEGFSIPAQRLSVRQALSLRQHCDW